MMAHVIVKISLEDFDKWKTVFDEYAEVRKRNGVIDSQVFRNSENPQEVLIFYEWDNLDHAWDFFGSAQNQKRLKEAGLQGIPKTFVLTEKELSFNPEK
jgi:heme-degrading monooxygenase HmoA